MCLRLSVTQKYPEELTNIFKSGVAAGVVGLFYGGLPAARHARQSYIQNSQAEIYTSRVDAVVGERRELQTLRCARVLQFFCSFPFMTIFAATARIQLY